MACIRLIWRLRRRQQIKEAPKLKTEIKKWDKKDGEKCKLIQNGTK